MSYNMYVPTRTLFGASQLNNLHTQKNAWKKAMIVISNKKSASENGFLEEKKNS
jgi:alcohol dehydrogenase